ncbi:MAG: carbon monoxide dehydrogenase [Candidatus Hydrogenedentota bacterium]|nr:MAG: carbon monoxide dehydrogenase [Candidatus Hydrogenedentota bacterium]
MNTKETLEPVESEEAPPIIGENLPRPEGIRKVCGTALYADDLKFDSCLFGRTVRSPAPRGRVRHIAFGEGIPWDEFVIVLPDDIPGENAVTLIEKSQPFLATSVRHIGEPVALIAHHDRALLNKALKAITVEIDEEPAIFSIEEALEGKEIQYGRDNIFKEYRITRGKLEEAFSEADHVLEGVYETGAQEQLYIEPQGVIARADPKGEVTIWGSIQCPFYVQKALAPLFALSPEKVRVIQTETGGGFGGKEEYPNLLSGHAALLSYRAGGAVVRMIYDRREDLFVTPKRHPSRTRIKSAFRKDGTFLGLEVDFVLDGGAYPTLSSTVLSRGILHSFGPYRIPHADLRARVVFTNSTPYGAFRGFGAPQSIFALELHLDRVAHELGLDPAELRRRNFVKKGDTFPTGQVIKEEIDLALLMDTALKKADYARKRKAYEEENRKNPRVKRGISLSVFFHGSGFTGSGEVMLGSKAAVRLLKDGSVEVLSANVEFGQGTNAMFTQITAAILGIPPEWVRIHQPDTAVVPNSGPTVASRTTMIVGRLVERAARRLRERVLEEGGLSQGYTGEEFRETAKRLAAREEFREEAQYVPPPDVHWDEQRYQGEAYSGYSWSCDVADVEVDMTTFQAEVKHFVSVVECGTVVNPIIAAGQIEGGIAQSIGYALYEDVHTERGVMVNNQYTNYIIPTTADIPSIEVSFIRFPLCNYGPFAAKGIGELPADGPAPAVAAAVAHALGYRYINKIPLLPERIAAVVLEEEETAA